MSIQFLRGNPQAPKGHAIFTARSTSDSQLIYCTYCIVPPIPMSLAKYLPPMFAAQLPPEELREAANSSPGMPIPPMLEEVQSVEYLEMLAERRDDDLCDLGFINLQDEGLRMQAAARYSYEYAQLYASYSSTFAATSATSSSTTTPAPLDDMDAEDILLQTMTDRQKLGELGKLVGMVRYALGRDEVLLRDTHQRMERITDHLAEKYRGSQLVAAAVDPAERGARLAELYMTRAYKLLDEEYSDIPGIEQAIRESQA